MKGQEKAGQRQRMIKERPNTVTAEHGHESTRQRGTCSISMGGRGAACTVRQDLVFFLYFSPSVHWGMARPDHS